MALFQTFQSQPLFKVEQWVCIRFTLRSQKCIIEYQGRVLDTKWDIQANSWMYLIKSSYFDPGIPFEEARSLWHVERIVRGRDEGT